MKKVLGIVILLVLAGVAYVYFSGQMQLPETAPTGEEGNRPGVENTGEEYTVPEGWQIYANNEYAFSFAFPSDWEVQEVLKPQEMRALHEVFIHATRYEFFRPSMTVSIFTNDEGVSVSEWWNAWLSEEDSMKAECIAEVGEDEEAPCLYLRDLITDETTTIIDGKEGILVNLFQFDSTKECAYVADEEYIFGLCHDGSNPNDPNFEANSAIYKGIVDSFVFRAVSTEEQVTEDAPLLGMWRSKDDDKAFKVFRTGNGFEEGYDGEVLSTGTWRVAMDGDAEVITVTDSEGEVFEYSIASLTEGELELIYLGRGNILRYERVMEGE
jgi:hypothetical protein